MGAPNASGHMFVGRQSIDMTLFHIAVERGDCIGWRCRGRCDLSYKGYRAKPAKGKKMSETKPEHPEAHKIPEISPDKLGVWITKGRQVSVGETVDFVNWAPRAYAIGVEAELRSVGFISPYYHPESVPSSDLRGVM